MADGLKTITYPVRDLARAKALYRELLGVEPYMDEHRPLPDGLSDHAPPTLSRPRAKKARSAELSVCAMAAS